MSDQGTNWEKVNHALQKQTRDKDLPLPYGGPNDLGPSSSGLTGQGSRGENTPEEVANPQGILAKWQVGSINRKAAVELAKIWRGNQLEVVKHRLSEVVRVRSAEASAIAEQMLASINTQHLDFLVQLGLRNEKQRREALAELTEQTTAFLRDAQNRDWPEALREQFIGGVMQRHHAFFEKIVTELGA